MTATRSLVLVSRWLPPIGIAVLLSFAFRLYDFTYFWIDDFNNLYWVQQINGSEMLRHLLDPTSTLFRPVGLAMYWVLWRCCDLDPVAYHGMAWLIHSLNVALVYLVLRHIVRSTYAAALGTALFAFQGMFSDIYWSFGTIFELLAAFLFLASIYLYIRFASSYWRVLLIPIVFLFAVKAKEMAITLPAVLAIYEWAGRRTSRGARPTIGILIAMAAGLMTLKAAEIVGDPAHPYYMDISILTLGRGYGWYFDRLFDVRLRWGAYAIASTLLLTLFLVRRSVKAVFFLLSIFVTLSPVIFLVNHRNEFYWYIPFFGVSGLVALAAKTVSDATGKRLSLRTRMALGAIVFVVFCREHYFREKYRSAWWRIQFEMIAVEHRAFVQGLRALPPPAQGQTIFFKSMPSHFDAVSLHSATQVAFKRTDIRTEKVDDFPEHAQYRIRFEENAVIQETGRE